MTNRNLAILSGFSMLFGAGMGIGLVFFGAWEPMSHFANPLNAQPGSEDAIRFAMEQSFIHWGVMSWVSYAVIGVSLAYFQFRKGRKGTYKHYARSYFRK